MKKMMAIGGSLLLASLLFVAAPVPAIAQLAGQNYVDGIAINWGFFPASAVAKEHGAGASNPGMTTDIPRGADEYHLTVALSNMNTSKQIGDAVVEASVFPVGLSGPWKTLQTMHINGTVSYGNYFRMDMASPDSYRILLRIRTPSMHQAVTASLTHYHSN